MKRVWLKVCAVCVLLFLLPLNVLAYDAEDEIGADLPIDITAIGRGQPPQSTLSLSFFEANLFSATSRRVNEAMVEQFYRSRMEIGGSLFGMVGTFQIADANEQTAYAAANLNLFAEPASFRRMDQADEGSGIPIWVVLVVLPVCAVLGYVLARNVVTKKEGKADVHNDND